MMLRFAAAIAALCVLWMPSVARAQCPSEYETERMLLTDEKYASYRVRELAHCIKSLRASVEAARVATEVAWSAAANPIRLLEEMPAFDHMHNTCDDMSRVLQSFYLQLRIQIAGDAEHIDNARAGLKALKKRFVKAEAWQLIFKDRAEWRRLIETKSTTQFALRCLASIKPLLEKPFDVKLAERAMDWYSESCAESVASPEARRGEHPECTVKTFPGEFKAHYGIELTNSHAYVLGWMRRRYLEGGSIVVAFLQSTALAFAKELATTGEVPAQR